MKIKYSNDVSCLYMRIIYLRVYIKEYQQCKSTVLENYSDYTYLKWTFLVSLLKQLLKIVYKTDKEEMWKKGKILSKCVEPRSFWVGKEEDTRVRRNN